MNSTGIPRDQLAFALGQPTIVLDARRRDCCLLCRGPHVNEAGLCKVCHALLREDEREIAKRWLAGFGP